MPIRGSVQTDQRISLYRTTIPNKNPQAKTVNRRADLPVTVRRGDSGADRNCLAAYSTVAIAPLVSEHRPASFCTCFASTTSAPHVPHLSRDLPLLVPSSRLFLLRFLFFLPPFSHTF